MKIIYPNADGTMSIITPAPKSGMTIEEIARKDVPDGVPYKIVMDESLPTDRSNRDKWTADFTSFDGRGIGQDKWYAEKKLEQGKFDDERSKS